MPYYITPNGRIRFGTMTCKGVLNAENVYLTHDDAQAVLDVKEVGNIRADQLAVVLEWEPDLQRQIANTSSLLHLLQVLIPPRLHCRRER